MIRTSSLRYFLVVSPCPGWMRAAFGAALLLGCATLWLNPAELDSALGSILVLQMFSASNGYAALAARGHYDPLLVSGRSRRTIALANLSAAALPGVVAWVGVAVMASALGRADLALAPHRQVALLLASVVPWAGGLALPRMAAGAAWALALFTLASSRGANQALLLVQIAPVGRRLCKMGDFLSWCLRAK